MNDIEERLAQLERKVAILMAEREERERGMASLIEASQDGMATPAAAEPQ